MQPQQSHSLPPAPWLCRAPTLTRVTGGPGARQRHSVLLGVTWPRGGEGIKALSWPPSEKDSAGEAQKDMLVLRTEAATCPSTRILELPQQWDMRGGCPKQGGSQGSLSAGVLAGTPALLLASPSLALGWAECGTVSGWAALAWQPPTRLGKPWGSCPSPSPLSWPTIGCPGDAGLDPHHWQSPWLSKQRGKQPQPAPVTSSTRPGTWHPPALPVHGTPAAKQSWQHCPAQCCQGG